MNEKRDFRVQRTYDTLINAFKELIQEKSFDAITVKELCDRARIRPATFYTHFNDKYDFFAFLAQEIHRQYFDPETFSGKFERTEDCIIYLMSRGFDFLDENEAFLKSMATDRMLPVIFHGTHFNPGQELEAMLQRDADRGAILLAEPKLLVQLFLGAIGQCGRWWTEHKSEKAKQEMIDELSEVIRKCIRWSENDKTSKDLI